MLKQIGLWFRKNPETIPLGIGVLSLLAAVALLVNPVRLVMHGKSAEGVVTDVVVREVHRANEKNLKDREQLESTATIRYSVGDRSMAIQHSWSLPRHGSSSCFAGCYSKGERLKVRYSVDDPGIARIESFGGLFGGPLALGLVGAMGIFFWRLWKSERSASASRE